MIQPLLSIQIPSTPDRHSDVLNLLLVINNQYSIKNCSIFQIDNLMCSRWYDECAEIEILIFIDNKEISIGQKRELLYKYSNGDFSWQIDSDDSISMNAIDLILTAIKANPEIDCIGFMELINIDGNEASSNISNIYGDWEGEGNKILWDGFTYHRTPFFKTPIKTALCNDVGVQWSRFGEDHDFARRVKPKIKLEHYIPEYIYYYIHKSSPFNERYGFDK